MDLLSDILSNLRVEGTLYFRTSFSAPWGVDVPAFENVARFHYAHKGRCFVRVADSDDAVVVEQGDLIIVPRGARHTIYSDAESEKKASTVDRVVEESGFDGRGALVWGAPDGDFETQLVCGHFTFHPIVSHPIIDALPSHILVKNYGESSGVFLEHTLKLINAETGYTEPGGDVIAIKLSEIIFAQALRAYLNSEGAQQPLLSAFQNPQLVKALEAIHTTPEEAWNLENLAELAGMSRTSFTSKFTESMDMSPLKYITVWRMQLARLKLLESRTSIINIAQSVGYQSEAAFGRVFKRHFGIAPASYRRDEHTGHDSPAKT